MEADTEQAHRWILIGGGVLGTAVSMTSDYLGFGYPGFGVLQGVGLLASVALVLVGVAGPDPVDPETPDVPRTPARFDPPLHTDLTTWVRPLARIPRRIVLPVVVGLLLVVGLVLLLRVTLRPAYEASATVGVAWSEDTGATGKPAVLLDLEAERDLLLSEQLASDASALAASGGDRGNRSVAASCPEGCWLDPATLRRHVRVETDDDAGRITVAFRDADPGIAAAGATAMVEAYVQNVASAPLRPHPALEICQFSMGSCQPAQQPIAAVGRTEARVPKDATNRPQPGDVLAFLLIAAVTVAGTRRFARTPEPADR